MIVQQNLRGNIAKPSKVSSTPKGWGLGLECLTEIFQTMILANQTHAKMERNVGHLECLSSAIAKKILRENIVRTKKVSHVSIGTLF